MKKTLLRSARRVAMSLLCLGILAGLCVVYARFIEPHWVSIKTVSLSDKPSITLIHISDIHHKGGRRFPFVGNPLLGAVDKKYCRGLFHTNAGPLYVNGGIGTYYWPIRFRSRPEITIIKL